MHNRGGNLIAYPDGLTTRTVDFTCSKIMWSSVFSTEAAKYAMLDIANFYLGTPLKRYKHMKMPIETSPCTSRNSTDDMRRYIKGLYG